MTKGDDPGQEVRSAFSQISELVRYIGYATISITYERQRAGPSGVRHEYNKIDCAAVSP